MQLERALRNQLDNTHVEEVEEVFEEEFAAAYETKQRKTFKMQTSELSRCDSVTFKLLRHYKRDKGFLSKLSASHPYDF